MQKFHSLCKYFKKIFRLWSKNLLKNIKEEKGLIFIYSNYVNYGGTSLLKIILDNNGYSKYGNGDGKPKYIALDNTLSNDQREKYRKIFNQDDNKYGEKIKIIIGSPLMAEGITLKNVKQIHILEPFWNMTRIEQIIGRGIRNYSHIALPEEERNVKIFKYVSIVKNEEKQSIDYAKYLLSEEKDRQNKKVERILKEYSVDCNFSKEIPEKYNYTAKCDYTTCKINCQGKIMSVKDDSTYKIFLDIFEKEKINYTFVFIENLIKENFIWSIEDLRRNIDERVSTSIILYVLYIYIKEKITIYDTYNRTGYLINIKDGENKSYIMFVPSGIKEKSTNFEKYMNFKRVENNMTIEEFIENYEKKQGKKAKIEKIEEIKHVNQVNQELTDEQKKINDNISKNVIYGSFYDRDGKKDELFRIVDKRNKIGQEKDDQRKQITGMVCSSYKKNALTELAEFLKIPQEKLNVKLDKDYLCEIIKKHLQNNNLILY